MKRQVTVFLVLILSLMALSACQGNTTGKDLENGSPAADTGYPAGEESAADTLALEEAYADSAQAYPIAEESLSLLVRTWSLSSRMENNAAVETTDKQLTIRTDGSYEVSTPAGATTGTWVANATAAGASLYLDLGTEQALGYDIVEINEGLLSLRTVQDGVQIDEQYLPAD